MEMLGGDAIARFYGWARTTKVRPTPFESSFYWEAWKDAMYAYRMRRAQCGIQ